MEYYLYELIGYWNGSSVMNIGNDWQNDSQVFKLKM